MTSHLQWLAAGDLALVDDGVILDMNVIPLWRVACRLHQARVQNKRRTSRARPQSTYCSVKWSREIQPAT